MLYGPEYESGKIFTLNADTPEPEPLRCGSCGQPVPELTPCTWDTRLHVGPCCATHPDVCQGCGYDLDDCRCPVYPRILIRPVRFASTMQPNLFGKDVA